MKIQKIQLNKEERRKIEAVVIRMRNCIENSVKYQLKEEYQISGNEMSLNDEDSIKIKEALVRERRKGQTLEEALKNYCKGTGFTVVNRIAALRCLEVRGFLDLDVTRFRDDGLTPAAVDLVEEEFYTVEEGVIKAYKNICERLEEEIEILFDLTSPYSIITPPFAIYKELCSMLDELEDGIWLADDVLGWVYEYYNVQDLDFIREKARTGGLDPDDTTIANQFYTPHWVVRMLTDNSLGKLYLEKKGTLEETIEKQKEFTFEERKNRLTTREEAPTIAQLCTYLIPTKEEGEATTFEDPKEIRVLDPACGSGHFLLYTFDVLERIWWAERPDIHKAEIPFLILKYNLYGVDLDLRACQIAAFNLYMKARKRAEEEDMREFNFPPINIVCADSRITDVEEAVDFFRKKSTNQPKLFNAFEKILKDFQSILGLGSLLNVKMQLFEGFTEGGLWADHCPFKSFSEKINREIDRQREESNFLMKDLKGFLNLLMILSYDYDVVLMNPPYGHRSRMPKAIKKYVESNYKYSPEYYINFFELGDRLLKENGRVGMLVPSSFMFKRTFHRFREDFIGEKGSFDFLAEYGLGILDNATVNTAGTVVRSGKQKSRLREGSFIRLHDVETEEKESIFVETLIRGNKEDDITRLYIRNLEEFYTILGSPLSYWVPLEIRSLYSAECIFDAENGEVSGRESLGSVRVGLQTGKDERFIHYFWEIIEKYWVSFAKGGEDSWMLPRINLVVFWNEKGEEIKRIDTSRPQNTSYYFTEAISFNRVKTKNGKRFGYLNRNSLFSDKGPVIVSNYSNIWIILSYTNSFFVTYLMIAQTPDRMWEVSEVSKLPWDPKLEENKILEEKTKTILSLLLSQRRHDFNSPYYSGPLLLKVYNQEESLSSHITHPHRELMTRIPPVEPNTVNISTSFKEASIVAEKHRQTVNKSLQIEDQEIDEIIFQHFNITSEQRDLIFSEIALRMGEDLRIVKEYHPEKVEEPPQDLSLLIKQLLLHFTLKAIEEDEDGIILLSFESSSESSDLFTRIQKKYSLLFKEYADDRLMETSEILSTLSNRSSSQEDPYSALKKWLQNALFDFHIQEFEKTPIVWKLTSENLVSKPKSEGFSCLIDYHRIDASFFDRLQNRYLEPRKTALRERRRAANQRRNDLSLPTERRNNEKDEYERCEDALQQIELFEEALRELLKERPRNWAEDNQLLSQSLVTDIEDFLARLSKRLETLDELVSLTDTKWIQKEYSPSFLKKVNQHREEWLDSLKDLKEAAREYSKPATYPVQAHLYDLFPYTKKVLGKTSYSSNGVLFMTYYFRKGKHLLNSEGEIIPGLSKIERLQAQLAKETEIDVEIGNTIVEKCKTLARKINSDWKVRAMEEITTGGFKPNHKHGVVLNIKPLSEVNIVPKSVQTKIL